MRDEDPYYANIMKIVMNVFTSKDDEQREINKRVARQHIEKGTKTIITICVIAYKLLTFDKVVDPIDSTDSKEIAHYILNII